MIKRSYTADFMNGVINHPDVKAGTEVKGIGDISHIVADLNNFVFETEFGGFVVIKKMPGVYECHTQFLPEGRGQHAVDAVREALRYMFIRTDCMRIVTKANVNNKAVQHFTAQFFRKRGQQGDHFYYSMDVDDWVVTDNESRLAGEEFHQLVQDSTNHEDDDIHSCFAGAAWLMALSGNKYKGQLIYNRWAVMAGYEPITILSESPLIVAIGTMKLALDQEGITCL